MPGTDSVWAQDSPNTDLELFLGISEVKDFNGKLTYTLDGNNIPVMNCAVSLSTIPIANIGNMLKRTGVYATPASAQEQFGTGASMPGPTAVANTSDPEGMRGYPPFTASKLATLVGPQAGPVLKGVLIKSVDVIYSVPGSGSLTSFTAALYTLNFANGTPIAKTQILGTPTFPLAAQANPYVVNVPVTNPAFLTVLDTQAYVQINVSTSATAQLNLYGFVVKCNFNFN